MKVLLNLTNHNLTNEQMESWDEVRNLPDNLKKLWSNIPPEFNCQQVKEHLKPIFEWIDNNSKNAVILTAGDFCAVLLVLQHAIKTNIKVVQSTTKRESVEMKNEDGTVIKKSVFKHVQFRELN